MEANVARGLKSGIGLAELWAGVLVGPVAALGQQEVNYALVLWACANSRTLPLHIVSFLALFVTVVAGILVYRHWTRLRAPEDSGGPVARGRFMAAVGLLTSLLMSLVIIAQWLSIIIHGPCDR
jgi:hypothetical protein